MIFAFITLLENEVRQKKRNKNSILYKMIQLGTAFAIEGADGVNHNPSRQGAANEETIMRNLVALLFASYITMDQFASANAEAVKNGELK